MVDYFHFILTIIFLISTKIKLSLCRGIDSPEKVLEELNKELNQPFEVNKTLSSIKNNLYYEIYISKIYPVFAYSNFSISNNSIILNDTKIILYMKSTFSIKSKSCYESISNIIRNNENRLIADLPIIMEINFSKVVFESIIEDHSYIPFYEFIESDITKSVHIELAKYQNYKFTIKDNEFDNIDKTNFFELYKNQLINVLVDHPVCDGLYYFKRLLNYINCTVFEIKIPSSSFEIEKVDINYINYKHQKINKTISQFINVSINYTYTFLDPYDYSRDYFSKLCNFSSINVFNNTIQSYGDFDCDYIDFMILESIINKAKSAIEV